MAWNSKDTALTINGIGSLASAWGQYKSDQTRNSLINKQLDYEIKKDNTRLKKMDKAQKNLDDAFADSALNKKKKKYDANGNEIVDSTAIAV